MNLFNVRKGYAEVVDYPEPGDDVCKLVQIRSGPDKGKWINIGMTPMAVRRTRGDLLEFVRTVVPSVPTAQEAGQ